MDRSTFTTRNQCYRFNMLALIASWWRLLMSTCRHRHHCTPLLRRVGVGSRQLVIGWTWFLSGRPVFASRAMTHERRGPRTPYIRGSASVLRGGPACAHALHCPRQVTAYPAIAIPLSRSLITDLFVALHQ